MISLLRRLKRGEKYDLSYILAHALLKSSLDERVLWLEQLIDWLRNPEKKDQSEGGSVSIRLKFLLHVLERNPIWKKNSADVICSVLSETNGIRLFAETGVPSWTTITQEFSSRLTKVFLPSSAEGSQSAKLILEHIFYDEEDSIWIASISDGLRSEVISWVSLGAINYPELSLKFVREAMNAMVILTMKSAAITIREDFSIRSPTLKDLMDHPLLKLEQHLIELRKIADQSKSLASKPVASDFTQISKLEIKLKEEISEAENIASFIKNHLQTHGVSIDLVYQRDRLKFYIERLKLLSVTVFSILKSDPNKNLRLYDLLSVLVTGSNYDRDFYFLVKKNLSLVAKKIVDFTGHTGESYIAQNRTQYLHLFWCAVGGGFITAFTVMGKYALHQENWAMFTAFSYSFLNYSLSFLVMHFLHFKLATKQPSMTAAALAERLKTTDSDHGDEDFVEEIAKITRSQFASILGNLVAVFPVALLLDWYWFWIHQTHYFDVAHAHRALEALNLWNTGTFIYAGMTGVLLWLSGIASGWVENAVVFYKVPDLVRRHKILKNIFGPKRASKMGDFLAHNISGITSSVSLGFFLAGWPLLGKFFGLPFDIRHITLTTGTIAMALQSIGFTEITWQEALEIGLEITVIGAMNFSVSFALASLVAGRAKELSAKRTLSIFKKAGKQWLRSPLRFLFFK